MSYRAALEYPFRRPRCSRSDACRLAPGDGKRAQAARTVEVRGEDGVRRVDRTKGATLSTDATSATRLRFGFSPDFVRFGHTLGLSLRQRARLRSQRLGVHDDGRAVHREIQKLTAGNPSTYGPWESGTLSGTAAGWDGKLKTSRGRGFGARRNGRPHWRCGSSRS
jgi:hypothetical protein